MSIFTNVPTQPNQDVVQEVTKVHESNSEDAAKLLMSMKPGDYLHYDKENQEIQVRTQKQMGRVAHGVSHVMGRCVRGPSFAITFLGGALNAGFKGAGFKDAIAHGWTSVFHNPKRVGKSIKVADYVGRCGDANLGFDATELVTSNAFVSKCVSLNRFTKDSSVEGETVRIGRLTYDNVRDNTLKTVRNRLGDTAKGMVKDLELRDLLAPNRDLLEKVALTKLKQNRSLTKGSSGFTTDEDHNAFLEFVAKKVAAQSQNFVQLADLLDDLDPVKAKADLKNHEAKFTEKKIEQELQNKKARRNEIFKNYSKGQEYIPICYSERHVWNKRTDARPLHQAYWNWNRETGEKVNPDTEFKIKTATSYLANDGEKSDRKAFSKLNKEIEKLEQMYMNPKVEFEWKHNFGTDYLKKCRDEFSNKGAESAPEIGIDQKSQSSLKTRLTRVPTDARSVASGQLGAAVSTDSNQSPVHSLQGPSGQSTKHRTKVAHSIQDNVESLEKKLFDESFNASVGDHSDYTRKVMEACQKKMEDKPYFKLLEQVIELEQSLGKMYSGRLNSLPDDVEMQFRLSVLMLVAQSLPKS